MLEFVFGVISILRLEVNENKDFYYDYGDQIVTQYRYQRHRTSNDKKVWKSEFI